MGLELNELHNLRERYQNNAKFHHLVKFLENFMLESKATPQDVTDALFLASIIIADQTIRDIPQRRY